jgi:ribonuclease P protein component
MPRDPRAEGLSRRHRFHVQGSFGPILRGARKLRGSHAVLHVSPGRPGASRFGIAVTRRHVRSAVDRNLVKRKLRETFRRHGVKRAGLDLVVTFRAPFDARDPAVFDEVRKLFDRAGDAA